MSEEAPKKPEEMSTEDIQARLDELAGVLKQEYIEFASLVAQGYSYGTAHKLAVKERRGGRGSNTFRSHTKASYVIRKNHPEIEEYVELSKVLAHRRAAEEIFATATDKRHALWEIVEECLKTKGRGANKRFLPRPAIAAIAELNQMDGHRAAIKQEINQTSNSKVSFEGVTEEEAAEAYQQMVGGTQEGE